jgi:hypothetical protein
VLLLGEVEQCVIWDFEVVTSIFTGWEDSGEITREFGEDETRVMGGFLFGRAESGEGEKEVLVGAFVELWETSGVEKGGFGGILFVRVGLSLNGGDEKEAFGI